MKIDIRGGGVRVTLTDAERNALYDALAPLSYPAGLIYEPYIEELSSIAGRTLGGSWIDVARELLLGEHPPAYVQFENLPVDPSVPSTPLSGELVCKPTSISENLLIALAEGTSGYCYGQRTEGSELINQVIAHPEHADRDTGLGYRRELKFHIENAALRHHARGDRSPWLLGLTGVRVDLSAPPATRIVDGRIEERLPDRVRRILREPRYRVRTPLRWDACLPEDQRWTPFVPVIQGKGKHLRVCAVFYGDMVQSQDSEAQAALKAYEAALEAHGERFFILPGTAVFICNDFALHARDRYDPKFEAGRAARWLQRIFVARDLARFEDWRTESDRIFYPR